MHSIFNRKQRPKGQFSSNATKNKNGQLLQNTFSKQKNSSNQLGQYAICKVSQTAIFFATEQIPNPFLASHNKQITSNMNYDRKPSLLEELIPSFSGQLFKRQFNRKFDQQFQKQVSQVYYKPMFGMVEQPKNQKRDHNIGRSRRSRASYRSQERVDAIYYQIQNRQLQQKKFERSINNLSQTYHLDFFSKQDSTRRQEQLKGWQQTLQLYNQIMEKYWQQKQQRQMQKQKKQKQEQEYSKEFQIANQGLSLPQHKRWFFTKNNFSILKTNHELQLYDLCSICCIQYRKYQKVVNLHCKHHFHTGCIQQWFKMNSKCPLCKKDFRDHKAYQKYDAFYEDRIIQSDYQEALYQDSFYDERYSYQQTQQQQNYYQQQNYSCQQQSQQQNHSCQQQNYSCQYDSIYLQQSQQQHEIDIYQIYEQYLQEVPNENQNLNIANQTGIRNLNFDLFEHNSMQKLTITQQQAQQRKLKVFIQEVKNSYYDAL